MAGFEWSFFAELGLIVLVATLFGIVFRYLKQPTILAYIFTGIVLGNAFLNVIQFKDFISIFSELGIAFLLFLVGLNLDLRVLREIGKASIAGGIGQIAFTTIFGFAASLLLGFSFLESLYIAIALSFSSTIIIVKLLGDKKELNSLYGKISVGILLVQDFVAILVLLFISSLGPGVDITQIIFDFVVKGIAFFAFAYLVAKFLLTKMFDKSAESQELLFLSAISWCMLMAVFSNFLGLSLEIGAFVAGVSLASIPYSFEVSGRIKNLRDFFLVLFFVSLGTSFVLSSLNQVIIQSLILSALVLIGNPLITMLLLLFLNYRTKTSFLAGLTIAQISEFSLIVVALGLKVGHISTEIVSIITLTAVITITISTYYILYSQNIYSFVGRILKKFERTSLFDELPEKDPGKEINLVIVGFGKAAQIIFDALQIDKKEILFVDFDPCVIKQLRSRGLNALYGDATDEEVIERLIDYNPKLILSTSENVNTDIGLLKYAKTKSKLPVIVLSRDTEDAKKLYNNKADLVLVPELISGKTMSEQLRAVLDNPGQIESYREISLMSIEKYS